jgi:propanol-preferring alcohol dehydrogenase
MVRSVANLTRRDGEEFLRLAAEVPLHIEVQQLPLAEANRALRLLRSGELQGVEVLICR